MKALYASKRYQRLREQKRCTRCAKQDARTLQGYSICESCKEKSTRPDKVEASRISRRNYMNMYYYRRQRNHQCTRCGVALANDYFYTCCPKCRQKEAEYHQKKKTAGASTPNGQKENNFN